MTAPSLFEIHDATINWGGCPDMRPWLVVRMPTGVAGPFGCFPISGNCYRGSCFPIEMSDPDFRATGLRKSCFVHDAQIIEIAPRCFARRRGSLSGDLLDRFRSYTGI